MAVWGTEVDVAVTRAVRIAGEPPAVGGGGARNALVGVRGRVFARDPHAIGSPVTDEARAPRDGHAAAVGLANGVVAAAP